MAQALTEPRKLLMLAVSALIDAGHPSDRLDRMGDLVSLENFKTILRHYLPKPGSPVSVFTRSLATALIRPSPNIG